MIKKILKTINTSTGKIVISIILGVGLASIFRKTCKNDQCISFKAPAKDSITNNTYFHDSKCYNFQEKSISCNNKLKNINFA